MSSEATNPVPPTTHAFLLPAAISDAILGLLKVRSVCYRTTRLWDRCPTREFPKEWVVLSRRRMCWELGFYHPLDLPQGSRWARETLFPHVPSSQLLGLIVYLCFPVCFHFSSVPTPNIDSLYKEAVFSIGPVLC